MEAGTRLETWQQAFEDYPILKTKAIEKQLRANISNDREKLRGLVGGNYRELLATAEEIVSLDIRTKNAESRISDIGQYCKPPQYVPATSAMHVRRSVIAQVRLLYRCSSNANTALAKNNLLQCAQLIVVARLLTKSLNEHESLLKSYEQMRNKIGSLRRRLIQHIDVRLKDPQSLPSALVEAVCAYCLITSASSADAVKHVQHLRLERLRTILERDDLTSLHIVESLRYQVSTQQVLKGLTGRAVNDAVGALQKRPILEDSSLRQLESLDIEGSRKSLPQEILSFIPYFKRTPLSPTETQEMLESWALEATKILIHGLGNHLGKQVALADVLGLRKDLYAILLPVYFGMTASSTLHESIHQVLGTHINRLCSLQVNQITSLGQQLTNLTPSQLATGPIWQESIVRMALENGASRFLQQVTNRRAGINANSAAISKQLRLWIESVRNNFSQFDILRTSRWRDILEEPDEDQEQEAVNVVESLTQKDPNTYISGLRNSLVISLAAFETIIHDSALHVVNSSLSGDHELELVSSHLRFIRHTIQPLHEVFPAEAVFEKLDQIIPRLYERLVTITVTMLLNDSASQSNNEHAKDPAGTTITSPENLPSPQAFSLLRRLCNIMVDVGSTDLWSPPAVTMLKKAVADEIFVEDTARRSRFIRTGFDEAYLGAALGQVVQTDDMNQTKVAREYWSRTRLLFGILA